MSDLAHVPHSAPLAASLAGLLLASCAFGCGRTPLGDQTADLSLPQAGGGVGGDDAGPLGDDASSPGDGQTSDAHGPAPVPVCRSNTPQCVPPDAGVVWRGAAVITCRPEDYKYTWTLLLERGDGIQFQVVQTQVLPWAESGATIWDTSAGPLQATYRVCVQDNDALRCGAPFTSPGVPHCGCEPTNCELLQVCNATIYDGCGSEIRCGACAPGVTCNFNHTCCADGFMPDNWGGCVCAPPPGVKDCCWNTNTCQCEGCGP